MVTDIVDLWAGQGGEADVEVPVEVADVAVVDGVTLAVWFHL